MKKTMKRLSALLMRVIRTTMITGEIYSILRMHMKCLVYIQP